MTSRKHHFVPRAWLRHFSVDERGKQVCVFDKRRGTSHVSSIADAGSENHFNTVDLGGRRIVFEDLFQGCDDNLAEILRSLVGSERLSVLTLRDRELLSHIAVIQMLRVNMHRTTIVETARGMRKLLRQYGDAKATDPPAEIEENEARRMALEMLSDAGKFVPHLLEKNWSLLRAPQSTPFWISDNPVVRQNMYPYGDAGLGSPGVEVAVPISSRLLLSLSCPTVATKQEREAPEVARALRLSPTFDCKPKHVDYYNSLQVGYSSRFLYGRSREFDLARKSLTEHPEICEVRSLLSGLEPGVAPTKERMPDGKWLVAYGARSHHMLALLEAIGTGGSLRVRIRGQDRASAQSMLEDGPFTLVEIYDNKVAVRGMRHVSADGSELSTDWIALSHTDPSLKDLMRQLDSGS